MSIEIKRRAAALGFAATGIARLDTNPHAAELDRWLAAGHAGTMTYLHRQAEQRKDPRKIMPGARCAVVTLSNYFHGSPSPHPEGVRSRVAQYAWSSDYHDVLGDRLEQLASAIREIVPGATTKRTAAGRAAAASMPAPPMRSSGRAISTRVRALRI